MKINVFTIFPEMFDILNSSIIGRAVNSGKLEINVINIRDFSKDKHKRVDDAPFGGGAGMVMMCQPIFDAFEKHANTGPRIYLSPKGEKLNNDVAKKLAGEETLNLLCGHYEGVDERVIENLIDIEISIGDYVLTGGELPAMVLIDCVSRFIPGVLGNELSSHDESFSDELLEYPQYTRPANFRGQEVPEVLLSGHHANIEKWKQENKIELTKQKRPDLLEKQNKKG